MRESVMYWGIRPFLRMLIHRAFDFDIIREGDIPDGPKVFVANHPTTIDPFLVAFAAATPVHILITEPIFRAPVLGRYLHMAGHIPVQLHEGRSAYDRALRLLHRGRSILVFPEGALSPEGGGLHPARTGAARLALTAGVPLVPVGIHVDRTRMLVVQNHMMEERGRGRFVVNGPYRITVGRPMYVEADSEDRQAVNELGRWIMFRIRALATQSEQRRKYAPALIESSSIR